ncbi:hypothetical protein LTR53_007347 [Teratosphaeriaceae sp. CCFEE 6253]|nr:hypothetical protein LTR53_007347 [Teratosphaeriaceae sp. CCFEE 6253]
MTCGYDHTLKLFSSETLQSSAIFDLGSAVSAHAASTVASHLLVACASQHPAVRLVDLKSGSSTHSLAGHSGSVLSVAWHPRNENILASGATDGTCRLWDVRRSASSLGVLDMDDSIGVAGYDGKGTGARRRERGKAHSGAVNGIAWTEDGQYLVTTGRDERMRVWNMTTGANTLANFGPALKNTLNTPVTPLLPPTVLSSTRHIFYPNPGEILSFDLYAGTLLRRLRVPQSPQHVISPTQNFKVRTTSLAWRPHDIEMYSAHVDGAIQCWRPRTADDVVAEQDDAPTETDTQERKRKRDELDQIAVSCKAKTNVTALCSPHFRPSEREPRARHNPQHGLPPCAVPSMAPKITCNPLKLASALAYIQKSRVAHSIKDLEKHLPSVASINGMQLKDYLQALQDENKINVEKIGSGNWYWSFVSQDKKTRQKVLDDVHSAHAKAAAVNDDLKAKLAEGEALRADEEGMLDDAGQSRDEVVARKNELEAETGSLQKELAAYSDNDPTELERKKQELDAFKKEASVCTDDVYIMEGWLADHELREYLVQRIQPEIYGDELDEDGVLKELPA